MKIRVYYEDTDSGGVVYHTNYLKFCERARSEIFFKKGELFKNSGFVMKSLEANFLKSARLGDEIEIKTYFKDIKKASITSYQEIFLEDIKLFTLSSQLVFLDNWKISKIPNSFLEIINEYKK